jgi:tetratricopeptide (TPR) repeat protein
MQQSLKAQSEMQVSNDQPESQSAVKPELQLVDQKSGWMNRIELASVVISVGGSVASVVMNQLAFATIPLSLTAALNLANRRRLIDAIAQSHQATTTQLIIQDQQQRQSIDQQIQTSQTKFEAVKEELTQIQATNTALSEQLQAVDAKGTNVETVLEKLREIDRCTQAIRTNPKVADFFFQRGQVRQSLLRMEDARLAIEDYTQAVILEPSLAKAYFHRGILRSELSEKRQAGEDLRLAAKCYFDQGEMDNYAEAKRLSEQIYEKSEQRPQETTEDSLRVADLFA